MLDPKETVSVISLVDQVISDAIDRGVSDIHFEPTDHGLRVRFRIDGFLIDQPLISKEVISQVLSRLKVLANINIAERRIPQDGKFMMVANGKSIDLRVSTFPGLFGQKIVVRILDRAVHMISLKNLGFEDVIRTKLEFLISRPNGFFLVTGPTGSGKTTTLYAALASLNSPEKNIVTLEDPVEYNLDGVTQGQIHPEVGFTFDQGVRSVLRQDPDIIMVGEIRHKPTAHAAIEAALTGHLVVSTLHTNDSVSAVMRLMDMGIEPFLINASLSGVLAQRLARTICTQCRTQVCPTDEQRQLMNRWHITAEYLYTGAGCDQCEHLGFNGRTGIFELLIISDALRRLIIKQPVFEDIYAQVAREGTSFLVNGAAQKVQDGIITLDEMLRVIV